MSVLKLFLSMALLTASLSGAASTSLGSFDSSGGGAAFGADKLVGAFSKEFTFDLSGGVYDFSFAATNTFAKTKSGIQNFTAMLDGHFFSSTLYNQLLTGNFKYNFLTGEVLNLAAGSHVLSIQGVGSNSSFGGSFDITAVPVPAAGWLMGSALIGLVSFGKRKKAG